MDTRNGKGARPGSTSTGRRLALLTAAIVGLLVCYLTFTALHGLTPAAQQEIEQARATATVQSVRQDDAGATVVAQIRAEATQTALAGLLSATPHAEGTPPP